MERARDLLVVLACERVSYEKEEKGKSGKGEKEASPALET